MDLDLFQKLDGRQSAVRLRAFSKKARMLPVVSVSFTGRSGVMLEKFEKLSDVRVVIQSQELSDDRTRISIVTTSATLTAENGHIHSDKLTSWKRLGAPASTNPSFGNMYSRRDGRDLMEALQHDSVRVQTFASKQAKNTKPKALPEVLVACDLQIGQNNPGAIVTKIGGTPVALVPWASRPEQDKCLFLVCDMRSWRGRLFNDMLKEFWPTIQNPLTQIVTEVMTVDALHNEEHSAEDGELVLEKIKARYPDASDEAISVALDAVPHPIPFTTAFGAKADDHVAAFRDTLDVYGAGLSALVLQRMLEDGPAADLRLRAVSCISAFMAPTHIRRFRLGGGSLVLRWNEASRNQLREEIAARVKAYKERGKAKRCADPAPCKPTPTTQMIVVGTPPAEPPTQTSTEMQQYVSNLQSAVCARIEEINPEPQPSKPRSEILEFARALKAYGQGLLK